MYPEALSNRQCTNKSREGSIYIYINSYSFIYTFQSQQHSHAIHAQVTIDSPAPNA